MNGFERRKEQKKENIRRSALELFKAHGIRKVSVNDIAGRAGVSPVTIYNHFGSKENLVRDVVKGMVSSTVDFYRAIMESDQPYLERFGRIVFEKNEAVRTYHGELIHSVLSEDPETRRFVEEITRESDQSMMAFMEEGQRQGYISPGLSQKSILLYTEMFQTMAFAHPELFGNREEGSKLLGELMRLFLYGVMGREEYPELLGIFRPEGQDS
jgi:AcrR family transcriptional regulator